MKFIILILLIGIAIRFGLYAYVSQDWLASRMEFASPLTSFERLKEATFLLFKLNLSPFSGSFFHVPPWLALPLMHMPEHLLFLLLVACDTITTVLLIRTTKSLLAGAVFFLNPFAILSPISLSLQSVHVLVAILIVSRTKFVDLWIAMLTVLKPISPIFLILTHRPSSVLKTFLWLGFLFVVSFQISGYSFVFPTFVSPVLISTELQPNVGIWWALFTVMFPASLPLFRIVANTHLLFLAGPLYYRNVLGPSSKIVTLCAVLLFQPYPTVLDFALFLALMVTFPGMNRLGHVSAQFMFGAQFFSSVTATLWLDRNTGNANFLFHLNMVSLVAGVIALGQAVRALRLAGYIEESKKIQ